MIPIADLNQAGFWIGATGAFGLSIAILYQDSETGFGFGIGLLIGALVALILLWGSIYITFGASI